MNPTVTVPRLGFLGLGWIGRQRMEALLESRLARVTVLADSSRAAVSAAAALVPDEPTAVESLDELLSLELDGVVIATPSALHAEQAVTALQHGLAVFVQKPLARTHAETDVVLAAARQANRPLGIDLSYRYTHAAAAAREALEAGRIGRVFAVDLVFHNAYGPDKPWFLERSLAGGGCVIDLATHMLDLALWLCHEPSAGVDAAMLLRRGQALADCDPQEVEDYCVAQLHGESGIAIRLACSWFLPAGVDCLFECTLYGTEGSLSVTNVDGSYYDFRLERRVATSCETLVEPPDAWGGRALCDWAARLGRDEAFDVDQGAELARLAAVIDEIYATGGRDG